MISFRLFASLVLLFLMVSPGCECSGNPGGGVGSPCGAGRTCQRGLVCIADRCAVPDGTDGGPMGSDAGPGVDAACSSENRCGNSCCGSGEECVDGFACSPVCANERCGDNRLVCCGAGQVCLDGVVCAASCTPDRPLCGAALELCCAATDVCVHDACVTPGEGCRDDYDCFDEGTYCEPTIGRCLMIPEGEVCELRPSFDRIALEIEWHWAGVTLGGRLYANVVATPVVGDVSGDGIPDVVVNAYSGASLGTSALVAIHGRTGATLWGVDGTSGGFSQSIPALANLDPSDDALEIVYVATDRSLVVRDGDGTTVLATFPAASTVDHGAPSIHDLDRDGDPEIILGARAFALDFAAGTFTLRSLFDSDACNQTGSQSVVANLDGDPALEITCGGVAYNTDGRLMWPMTGGIAGYAAVADLDRDGAPEVVMVKDGSVTVRDGATGVLRMGDGGSWYSGVLDIPGGGEGGPPTIADFDGDGLPELSSAGRGAYAVYDPDCIDPPIPGRTGGTCDRMAGTTGAIRWSAPVQDLSSSRTGSSVFDFQGDGIAEVVYNDECFLHVFDGRAGGEILMEPFPNSSRTAAEYPIVVDVDRDGNSEIVVVANNDQIARDDCRPAYRAAFGYATDAEIPDRFRDGTQGVYALGDPGDRWVRTRPIWNQFAYSVTHVDDHGAIPATPEDNWTVPGLNNFRQNVQGTGVFNAPNLAVELEVVAACGRREIRLSAVVRNIGSRGIPSGVPVEFSQTAPMPGSVIATLMTSHPLLPGGSERLTAVSMDPPEDMDLSFMVRVDGDEATSTIAECNEDDNLDTGTERCPGLL